MKIGPLALFERRRCNDGKPSKSILLAALHYPWSLTWRFHCSWTPVVSGRIGPYFMRTYNYIPGLNFTTGLNLPVVGSFSIQTQPNMPIKVAPKPGEGE